MNNDPVNNFPQQKQYLYANKFSLREQYYYMINFPLCKKFPPLCEKFPQNENNDQ